MQIEVVYSNSMKINRGNYEQEAPFYSVKSILEVSDPLNAENVCNSEYERLKGIVEPLLQADYNKKRTDLANVRIREKDGKKYPSVTSILKPDGIYKVKNIEQYIARGNEADRVFKCLMTGKDPGVIDQSKFPDLKWEYDIKQFILDHKLLKKSEIPIWKSDIEIFNDKWIYSGEIDLIRGDLLLDVKTGQWDWQQVVAYAEAVEGVTEIMIADLKENKCHRIDKKDPKWNEAWLKFIFKRGEFQARFGI